MKIQTILNQINGAIIPDTYDTIFNFLTEYRTNYTVYDNYILRHFGGLMLNNYLVGSSDGQTIDNVQSAILSDLLTNNLSISKIYDAVNTVYNPLENYDKNSTITNTNDKITNTNNKGKTTSTESLGATNSSDTILNQTTGYDSTAFVDNDKTTNTNTSQAVTNSNTIDAVTDTNIISGSGENGKIINQTVEKTAGNIGVTTSQQMLQSEIDLRSNFRFYDYLFGIVVDAISVPIFESED